MKLDTESILDRERKPVFASGAASGFASGFGTRICTAGLGLVLFASIASGQEASIPDFNGKSLAGQDVHKENLVGAPSILIVNPSPEAGDKSKAWAQEIRKRFGAEIRQRTIIAVDAPFFVTEYMALQRAQSRVDRQYWDRTWLLKNTDFEEKIGIGSGSADPHVLVLDANGSIIARVQGELSTDKFKNLQMGWRKVAQRDDASRKPASSSK